MNSPADYTIGARTFPNLRGTSLSGASVDVPADLIGETNLVFVPFLQRQQLDINRWIRKLGPIEDLHKELALYEIPLMRRFPKLYQSFIDTGMRAGIPDPQARSRTVTVYTDRAQFLAQAGLENRSKIWVVLVDRVGTIFWSHIGEYSEEAAESLSWSIEQLI
jgi:hypothetical protein